MTHTVERPILLVDPEKLDLSTCLQAADTGMAVELAGATTEQTPLSEMSGTPIAMKEASVVE